MSGDNNPAVRQVTVDGRILADLADTEVPGKEDTIPTPIRAGDGRVVGFNITTRDNYITHDFSVTTPSADDRFVFDIVDNPRKVAFSLAITDESQLPDGAFTGFSSIGYLGRSRRPLNTEAAAQAYSFRGAGYTMTFKNQPPIVKG